jgi:parallel beta-helix repeat protein
MIRHACNPLAILCLSLAVACSSDKSDTGDGSGTEDGGSGDGGDGGTPEDGCILIDGGGGYALLADAIEAAAEGATITMCEGTFDESVTITKSLTIDGAGLATLNAPVNTSAITIEAADVTITGLEIASTRHGVVISESTGVTLTELVMVGIGNYAITAEDSEGLTIEGCSLSGNGYGGISIDGGDATLTDNVIADNISFGVVASGSADLTMSGNSISGSIYTADTPDGIGLSLSDGASATSVGDTFSSNELVNVYADQADVSLEGATLTGSSYGMFVSDGDVSLSDTTISESVVLGGFVYSTGPIRVSNVTVTTDSKTSEWLDIDEWDGRTGTGLALWSDDIEVSGFTTSGWNNAGLFIADPNSIGGIAILDGLNISDVGQYGVASEYMATTITNSSVTGTRVVEPYEDYLCYYINYYAAIYGAYSSFNISGLTLDANEGWGLGSVYGDVVVENSTLNAGVCATLVTYEAALYAAGNTFTGGPSESAISTNYSTGDSIIGNTFQDNQVKGETEVTYDYMDKYGYTYTYTYGDGYPSAVDISIYGATSVTVEGNTFVNGDTSISMSSTSGTVSGNTWTNYRGYGLYTSDSEIEFSDNTLDGFSVYGVACSTGSLEVSDSTFNNGTTQTYDYSYLYEYSDGTTYSGSYTNTNNGYAVYSSGCDLEVKDSTFNALAGKGIYVYNYDTTVAVDLVDLDFSQVGTAGSGDQALYTSAYSGTVDLYLSGVNITDVASAAGISLSSSSATVTATMDDLTVTGADLAGLSATSIDLSLSNSTLSDNGTYGLYITKSTASVTGLTAQGNASSGAYIATTTADVTFNTLTANGTYGMECSTADFTACNSNDLTENGSGPHLSCEDACAEF